MPRLGLLLIALLVLATGCSEHRVGPSESAPPTTATATPSEAAGQRADPDAPILSRSTIHLRAGMRPGWLTPTRRGIAFSVENRDGARSRLMWADYRDRVPVEIAAAPRGWYVGQVAADAGRVAWVEQERFAGDGPGEVSSRVRVHDLRAGTTRTVLHSAYPGPIAPGILLRGDELVYNVSGEPRRLGAKFAILDLRTGHTSVVARGLLAGQLAFDGEHVVTVVTTSLAPLRTDVHVLTPHGLRRVTHDGRVEVVRVADGHLMWTTRRRVHVRDWPGEAGHLRAFRRTGTLPSLGRGFVAFSPSSRTDRCEIRGLETRLAFDVRAPAHHHLTVACVAAGRRIAFATASRADRRVRVVVALLDVR